MQAGIHPGNGAGRGGGDAGIIKFVLFFHNEQLCNRSWGSDKSHRVNATLSQIGNGRL